MHSCEERRERTQGESLLGDVSSRWESSRSSITGVACCRSTEVAHQGHNTLRIQSCHRCPPDTTLPHSTDQDARTSHPHSTTPVTPLAYSMSDVLSPTSLAPPTAPPILPLDPPPQATSRLPHVARADRLPRSLLSRLSPLPPRGCEHTPPTTPLPRSAFIEEFARRGDYLLNWRLIPRRRDADPVQRYPLSTPPPFAFTV